MLVETCTHKNVKHIHGTIQAYKHCKCRCEECKKANRLYGKKQGMHDPEGRKRISPDEAIKHIGKLIISGYSVASISRASGVNHSVIHELIYGRKNRKTGILREVSLLHRDLAKAIMDVPLPKTSEEIPVTPRTSVPALGTRRRIEALHSIGYSSTRISMMTGIDDSTMCRTMVNETISAYTRDRIKDFFDSHWDKPFQPITRGEASGSGQAKAAARRNKWLLPIEIDEDNIEDLTIEHTPYRETKRKYWAKTDEKLKELEFLCDMGVGWAEVIEKMGWKNMPSLEAFLGYTGRWDIHHRLFKTIPPIGYQKERDQNVM